MLYSALASCQADVFHLRISGFGVFFHRQGIPRVLYAEVDHRCEPLRRVFDSLFNIHGISYKQFKPHITLARVKVHLVKGMWKPMMQAFGSAVMKATRSLLQQDTKEHEKCMSGRGEDKFEVIGEDDGDISSADRCAMNAVASTTTISTFTSTSTSTSTTTTTATATTTTTTTTTAAAAAAAIAAAIATATAADATATATAADATATATAADATATATAADATAEVANEAQHCEGSPEPMQVTAICMQQNCETTSIYGAASDVGTDIDNTAMLVKVDKAIQFTNGSDKNAVTHTRYDPGQSPSSGAFHRLQSGENEEEETSLPLDTPLEEIIVPPMSTSFLVTHIVLMLNSGNEYEQVALGALGTTAVERQRDSKGELGVDAGIRATASNEVVAGQGTNAYIFGGSSIQQEDVGSHLPDTDENKSLDHTVYSSATIRGQRRPGFRGRRRHGLGSGPEGHRRLEKNSSD